MTREDVYKAATAILARNNIKKKVQGKRVVFHISDDDGNTKDFVAKKSGSSVQYTQEDVRNIMTAFWDVVEEALKRGEEVTIFGYGTFYVQKRAQRNTLHPETGKPIIIKEHYVPKFAFGKTLKVATKVFDSAVNDSKLMEPVTIPYYDDEEDGDE